MTPERAAVATAARPILPIAVMMPVAILMPVAGTGRMAAVPLVMTEPGSMTVGPLTV
ncbi:hypothetical protein LGH83_11560 [Lichenihabitans sp. PAMC28606]|uniref:hypothetical protein n=1 Tax=Lichenihabitans sp. PAMC28606 TaxID=2880932 RepID=UPI001D09A186|nr:hypothetical protein [Lichenihabitans sp. PAMC28606]UDL93241.1 hypothetical protein LGH83_11560 [Lichenihabitans sp. PAMC28606]